MGGLVGLGRFELPTSPLSGVRSNQLSYRPENSIRAPVRSNLAASRPRYRPEIVLTRTQAL